MASALRRQVDALRVSISGTTSGYLQRHKGRASLLLTPGKPMFYSHSVSLTKAAYDMLYDFDRSASSWRIATGTNLVLAITLLFVAVQMRLLMLI
jgi:hypothetical protein